HGSSPPPGSGGAATFRCVDSTAALVLKSPSSETALRKQTLEGDAMKQTIGFTLSVLVAVLLLAMLYSGPASGAAAPDGKALFLAQKCNMCHNVPAAGIERTVKSEKMAGPDLVNVKVDAATLGKVLRR